MSLWQSLIRKLGLSSVRAERHPIRVFLLDDDERRHRWFTTRFKGDFIDIASNVDEAQKLLSASSYDAIFLDHDLHPEHYHADSTDGYAWYRIHVNGRLVAMVRAPSSLGAVARYRLTPASAGRSR